MSGQPEQRSERIGVYGGTFDPVHVGHLVVATECRHALGLDRVLLVVAGDPWQKRGQVVADAAMRFLLVQAAVEGVPGVEASDVEIVRGTPSVTADTLEALAGPHRELFLILGADAVANMPTWRRLEDTRELATVVVVERAGDQHASPPGPGWAVERVAIPRLDVSSSEVRDRLGAGRPIDGLVPSEVVREIAAHGLYTGPR
jgi:nicotinate-nucleotide adenylyltransferase